MWLREPFMSAHACCGRKAAAPRRSFWRGASGSVLSGTLLVLMPKCPMCIAAYIAVVTGAGASVLAATYLREGMLVLWVGSLVYLVVRCFLKTGIIQRAEYSIIDSAPRLAPRTCGTRDFAQAQVAPSDGLAGLEAVSSGVSWMVLPSGATTMVRVEPG